MSRANWPEEDLLRSRCHTAAWCQPTQRPCLNLSEIGAGYQNTALVHSAWRCTPVHQLMRWSLSMLLPFHLVVILPAVCRRTRIAAHLPWSLLLSLSSSSYTGIGRPQCGFLLPFCIGCSTARRLPNNHRRLHAPRCFRTWQCNVGHAFAT